jgi:hypothetical protein
MAEYQLQRELVLLKDLKQIRERVEQRYGIIQEDVLGEVREGRSAQIDRILKAEDLE